MEAGHWDRLHEGWIVGRIKQSDAYAADGANTYQVESYFSRLRRIVMGQHHGVSPKYLHQYTAHAAWPEATAAARMATMPTRLSQRDGGQRNAA